jgi:hypothetical protein
VQVDQADAGPIEPAVNTAALCRAYHPTGLHGAGRLSVADHQLQTQWHR